MRRREGSSEAALSSRFTVGGQFLLKTEKRINVSYVLSHGPWAGVEHYPFHCWTSFRTSRILNNVTLLAQPWGYTGGNCHPAHHPFHCWTRLSATIDDTLLTRECQNLRNGQKTLG